MIDNCMVSGGASPNSLSWGTEIYESYPYATTPSDTVKLRHWGLDVSNIWCMRIAYYSTMSSSAISSAISASTSNKRLVLSLSFFRSYNDIAPYYMYQGQMVSVWGGQLCMTEGVSASDLSIYTEGNYAVFKLASSGSTALQWYSDSNTSSYWRCVIYTNKI